MNISDNENSDNTSTSLSDYPDRGDCSLSDEWSGDELDYLSDNTTEDACTSSLQLNETNSLRQIENNLNEKVAQLAVKKTIETYCR